jgi:putative resolvase
MSYSDMKLADWAKADYIEAALRASNRELRVINEQELNTDLVQDMVDAFTSFCARLYGQRSAKNRAKKALEAAQK